MLITIAACGLPRQAGPEDGAVEPSAPEPDSSPRWPTQQRAVAIDIHLGPRSGGVDALRAAQAEWRLSAVSWLVPRISGEPTRPGLASALVASPASHSLRFEDGLAEFCGPWSGCRPAEDAVAALLEQLGAEPVSAPAIESHSHAAAHALFTGGRRLRRAPAQPLTSWLRARHDLRRGDPERAIVRLGRALRALPTNLGLRADLAAALQAGGRPEEAAARWTEVAEQSPLDPRYALPRARAALEVGDAGPARRLLVTLPDELRGLAGIAALRDALRGEAEADGPPLSERHPVARPELRALADDPAAILAALRRTADPIALVLRGRAQLEMGEARPALRDAERALRGRPWLPEALGLKADALRRLGRREQAAEADRLRALAAPDGPGAPRRLPQR